MDPQCPCLWPTDQHHRLKQVDPRYQCLEQPGHATSYHWGTSHLSARAHDLLSLWRSALHMEEGEQRAGGGGEEGEGARGGGEGEEGVPSRGGDRRERARRTSGLVHLRESE